MKRESFEDHPDTFSSCMPQLHDLVNDLWAYDCRPSQYTHRYLGLCANLAPCSPHCIVGHHELLGVRQPSLPTTNTWEGKVLTAQLHVMDNNIPIETKGYWNVLVAGVYTKPSTLQHNIIQQVSFPPMSACQYIFSFLYLDHQVPKPSWNTFLTPSQNGPPMLSAQTLKRGSGWQLQHPSRHSSRFSCPTPFRTQSSVERASLCLSQCSTTCQSVWL